MDKQFVRMVKVPKLNPGESFEDSSYSLKVLIEGKNFVFIVEPDFISTFWEISYMAVWSVLNQQNPALLNPFEHGWFVTNLKDNPHQICINPDGQGGFVVSKGPIWENKPKPISAFWYEPPPEAGTIDNPIIVNQKKVR